MAQDFTTTALLASLKRRGMLPSNSNTLSTADFLAIATEELQTYVFKLLLATREEFAVTTYDLTLTSGTAAYKLPSRAVGGKLRNVASYDTSSGTLSPLLRLEPERISETANVGSVSGYYLQGDDLVFVPTPGSAATVRITYFRRPSALVLPAAVFTISEKGHSSLLAEDQVPSTFSSDVTFDIVRAKPPFSILYQDLTVNLVGAFSITLDTVVPSDVSVGDYVCLAGESPVAQVPVELHPLLSQRTVYKCLEALGDEKAATAEASADKMRADALTLLTPRVEGASRPIVNFYGPGFKRSGR
jgi:hypothetical protein